MRRGLLAAAALLLTILVVRQAAVDVLGETRPDLALAVAPGDPVALIGASGFTETTTRPPSADQLGLLDRAARADPLYPEPFFARAMVAAAQGQDRRAIGLGLAARARDPRRLATHVLLLREYARIGDVPAAIAAMNPIALISGETGPALAAALTTVAADPNGSRVVAAALRRNPRWRGAFVRNATGSGQALAYATLVASPSGVSRSDEQDARKAFLSQLVQRGDYQRAYLAWINFLPPSRLGEVTAVYDGAFAGLPGTEPFNWTLRSDEIAVSERRTDSALPGRTALDVNFFGSDAATIATETLLVSPGRYRFQLMGTADGGGDLAGRLRWQLTCLPSQTTIPLATVAKFDGHPFKVSTPVIVPDRGCDAQQLTLLGDPGEIATLIHAQFTGVGLVAS
ncbi:MAG: tetratricopeptide repeat protein [Janthinobacterium lividum]